MKRLVHVFRGPGIRAQFRAVVGDCVRRIGSDCSAQVAGASEMPCTIAAEIPCVGMNLAFGFCVLSGLGS